MRLEKWFISNLDDSQRKIIVQSIDEDIIVQGAAGSGKTAQWKSTGDVFLCMLGMSIV